MMKRIWNSIETIILLLIILICVLPFLYMFFMSFKSTLNAYDLHFSLGEMTLEHYRTIFGKPEIIRYFFNSLFVSVCGVLLTLVTSSLAGYAFARLRFKGNDFFFLLVTLTMFVPGEAILIQMYTVVRGMDMINTFWALILPLPSALGVFIVRQAILAVPMEIIESARIDGARELSILVKMILPLIKSALLTVGIFAFIGAWNSFTWPLIVTTKDEMRTLPVALTTLKTQYDTDVGLVMACAVLTFLPPFIVYLLMQSRFEEGIAQSGLKG